MAVISSVVIVVVWENNEFSFCSPFSAANFVVVVIGRYDDGDGGAVVLFCYENEDGE